VGSASIALWARHGLGARNQAFSENASVFIRLLIAALHKPPSASESSRGREIRACGILFASRREESEIPHHRTAMPKPERALHCEAPQDKNATVFHTAN
jgi:hypothetical protein